MKKKDIRLYNVLFPIWFYLLFPQVWLLILSVNFLIDSLVVYFSTKQQGLENAKALWKDHILPVWGIGFLSDLIGAGLIFGIYCSSSCPPFYAQNNGGAARVFCLVYYLMILALAMIYFYSLGAIYRLLESKKTWKLATASPLKKMLLLQGSLVIVFLLLLLVRPWSASYVKPHAVTALQVLSNGEAAYYEEQYQERLAILEDDSILDVTFAPYDVPESLVNLLYLGDISTDASHDVNRNMATLYGKNSIKLE